VTLRDPIYGKTVPKEGIGCPFLALHEGSSEQEQLRLAGAQSLFGSCAEFDANIAGAGTDTREDGALVTRKDMDVSPATSARSGPSTPPEVS
jgi:hypothetical protein